MANRHGGIYRWNESTYNPITGTTKVPLYACTSIDQQVANEKSNHLYYYSTAHGRHNQNILNQSVVQIPHKAIVAEIPKTNGDQYHPHPSSLRSSDRSSVAPHQAHHESVIVGTPSYSSRAESVKGVRRASSTMIPDNNIFGDYSSDDSKLASALRSSSYLTIPDSHRERARSASPNRRRPSQIITAAPIFTTMNNGELTDVGIGRARTPEMTRNSYGSLNLFAPDQPFAGHYSPTKNSPRTQTTRNLNVPTDNLNFFVEAKPTRGAALDAGSPRSPLSPSYAITHTLTGEDVPVPASPRRRASASLQSNGVTNSLVTPPYAHRSHDTVNSSSPRSSASSSKRSSLNVPAAPYASEPTSQLIPSRLSAHNSPSIRSHSPAARPLLHYSEANAPYAVNDRRSQRAHVRAPANQWSETPEREQYSGKAIVAGQKAWMTSDEQQTSISPSLTVPIHGQAQMIRNNTIKQPVASPTIQAIISSPSQLLSVPSSSIVGISSARAQQLDSLQSHIVSLQKQLSQLQLESQSASLLSPHSHHDHNHHDISPSLSSSVHSDRDRGRAHSRSVSPAPRSMHEHTDNRYVSHSHLAHNDAVHSESEPPTAGINLSEQPPLHIGTPPRRKKVHSRTASTEAPYSEDQRTTADDQHQHHQTVDVNQSIAVPVATHLRRYSPRHHDSLTGCGALLYDNGEPEQTFSSHANAFTSSHQSPLSKAAAAAAVSNTANPGSPSYMRSTKSSHSRFQNPHLSSADPHSDNFAATFRSPRPQSNHGVRHTAASAAATTPSPTSAPNYQSPSHSLSSPTQTDSAAKSAARTSQRFRGEKRWKL